MPVLTDQKNLAVQAKLNFMLGAEIYDTYFQGFRCTELSDGIVTAFARSEYMAGYISGAFSNQVAAAVASVTGQSVTKVVVLPCRKSRVRP